MLLIDCPWCGPRDSTYIYKNCEAHIKRPEDPDKLSDVEWADYLFMRTNPKGKFSERWVHTHGCNRWFNAVRDTVTHNISATYGMGEDRPEGQS